MTGLDLESFLQLLRADLGAWASLGLVAVVLALMTWTSWGSRRALRKCLVLSIAAHLGLVLYGSTFPIVLALLRDEKADDPDLPPVRVQLSSTDDLARGVDGEKKGPDGRPVRAVAIWDRAGDSARVADPTLKSRPDPTKPKPLDTQRAAPGTIAPEAVVLEVNPPPPTTPVNPPATSPGVEPPSVALSDPSEVAAPVASRGAEATTIDPVGTSGRVRPEPGASKPKPIEIARPDEPAPGLAAPTLDLPPTTGSLASLPAPVPPATQPGPAVPAEPGEVAAPNASASRTGTAPDDFALPAEANLRSRSRSNAEASTLAMLEPSRSSTNPIAPASTTLESPAGQGTGVRVTPAAPAARAANLVAPSRVVAADAAIPGPVAGRQPVAPAPSEALPEANVRRQSRPGRQGDSLALNDRRPELSAPATLPRVSPTGMPGLPVIAGATGLTRPPADVPPVYRSRLDPNRFALAQRAGASRESEQAVERALEWLRRHQDPDGRWDGGTAKYKDGTVAEGDDDYTAHCPPGDVCFGECYYWEADTALTGLALLSYLGAGYTHLDGQYSDTVSRGLEYLRLAQKADGDLRGRSQAVGMYCHAMATLALCEAYALTGDPKLRAPVEKAVGFLLKARAKDGLAWRYGPGAPVGDTSILGWVVMVLKSAQEVGIPIQANTKTGITGWLAKTSSGPAGGLARYQPGLEVTPTMTAEAWVCRQFLGVGGPGQASNEASDYLLRNPPDRVQYNLYYWYYATLAMYQQGGESWSRWNAQARDQIIRRQRLKGHATGSWDPDDSQYGTHGGRIYCTALATLSLEVYYRYLRLYETPATPSAPSVNVGTRRPALISEPMAPR